VVFSVSGVALDAPAAEPQKAVLALYGSRPDLPSNVIVDEVIRSTLERELGPRLDFYAEFLDTARWPEGEAQIVVHDFLRRKYAQRRFSVIIAVARPAINFLRIYGDELFPGVPIVAYGDSDALRDWEPGRPITGTLAKIDPTRTAELILRLQPGTREIVVISGASDSDRWRESEARRQLDPLEKRVKLTYMDAGSVQDFVRTVARVPDGTVILFLSVYEDSTGNKLLSHEVLARIAREARVPVYNQTATNVGFGIVGGVVFDPEILGRETAQLTLRFLRGERLQDLPVQESKSTVPMVDWRQLRRWGLDEKRLPAGTVVRFREASVWQTYKWYIIGTVSLILVEAILIFGLILERKKRRSSEEYSRSLVLNAPVAMAVTRGHGQVNELVNRRFTELFGYTMTDVPDEASWWPLAFPDEEYREAIQGEWQRRVDRALIEQKHIDPMEAQVCCKDGSIRHIEFHFAFLGETSLISFVDLTDRQRAEIQRRESEDRFRLAQQAARIGTFERNLKTGVTTWTPELEAMYGLPEGSFGQTRATFKNLLHPDDRATVLKLVEGSFKTRQPTDGEWRVVWPDGQVHWISGRWQAFTDESGKAGRVIGVNMDVTERKFAEEAMANFGGRLIRAHEEERAWIGRELHDNITQQITLIAIELARWEGHSAFGVEANDQVRNVCRRLSDLGKEVQALSHHLHSSKLEYLGLAKAAWIFCKELSEQYKVEIEFNHSGVSQDLSQEISLCLFRVLQEALQNAVKYSGVRQFKAELLGALGELKLTVSDRGVGFHPKDAGGGRGLGLISMRERMQLVGGELLINSELGLGTTISARVPTEVEHQQARAAG